MPITSCSVRVMRSFDYCHFEIVLGATANENSGPISTADVDNLRKEAARLADKAVTQYKALKKDEEERVSTSMYQRMAAVEDIEKAREKNETDRTVHEKAAIKAYDDRQHRLNREHYSYQDDWEDSYPD